MSKSVKLFAVILLLFLISYQGAILAGPPDEKTVVEPESESGEVGPAPLFEGRTISQVASEEMVEDGSFEDGPNTLAWEVTSTNYPDSGVICREFPLNCTGTGDSLGSQNGNYWAWLGGSNSPEVTSLTQTVTISNTGSATLSFWLAVPAANDGAGDDFFRVTIDDDVIFEVEDTITATSVYTPYTEVVRDVSGYADGGSHTLRFHVQIEESSSVDSYFVDNISLTASEAITGEFQLYLPLVLNNAAVDCVDFPYDETLRYNIDIINADEAWGCASGGAGITIAILDTGVDLDHPDLQANLVPGATFVGGTSTPDDDQGHGSHVAGAAAAVANNGGVVGVAPNANIMPVKVLNSFGSGSTSAIAAGINHAVENGAKVINLSLGGPGASSTMRNAINEAYGKGVLVVAAGGNCGDENYEANGCTFEDQTNYPAAYTSTIAVASTNQSDQQSSFSNEGSYVEIAAPGSAIFSTTPGGNYNIFSGTSQATPHAAGLAALIWAKNPSLTNAQVRAIMQANVVDLGAPGKDVVFGFGRIDALLAVNNTTTSGTVSAASVPVAPPVDKSVQASFASGEILVKLQPGVTLNQVLANSGMSTLSAQTMETVPGLDVIRLSVPAGQEEAVIAELTQSAGVEYAEPNYIYWAQ